MLFTNYIELNGKTVAKPLFSATDRIIAFDAEGVLLLQKGVYKHGVRDRRKDDYVLHAQAKSVVRQALEDFNKVVLWSTHCEPLQLLIEQGFPFTEVHRYIAGGRVINDNLVKDLRILSPDIGLKNVIAIEDDDIYFDPLNRVVPVSKHESLVEKYLEARRKVNGRN